MTKLIALEIEHRLGLAKRLDGEFMGAFDSIRRLARKHHRLQEMECNGEGYVHGRRYYAGTIDEWALREYGTSVRSVYVDPKRPEDTIFTIETERIEAKINALCKIAGLKAEYQMDPRGATVKIAHDVTDLTDLIWE